MMTGLKWVAMITRKWVNFGSIWLQGQQDLVDEWMSCGDAKEESRMSLGMI